MSELAALFDKAKENLRASEVLNQEGFPGIAISRAYYAMFYAAEAVLLSENLLFSTHSAVISAFGREFAKTGRFEARYHRFLIDAQDARNLSDYGTTVELSAEKADQVIAWAHDFLTTAEIYLSQK